MEAFRVVWDISDKSEVYYDPEKKCFYQAKVTGCAHEGIWREYSHISKEETIKWVSDIIKKTESYYSLFRHIPLSEIEALEEAPNWDRLSIPQDDLLY